MSDPQATVNADALGHASASAALAEEMAQVMAVVAPLIGLRWVGVGNHARPVTLSAMDEAFAPLPRFQRRLARILVAPGEGVVGLDVNVLLGRMAALAEGASDVLRTKEGLSPRRVERAFAELGRAGEPQAAFRAAALIALTGQLPLGLDAVDALVRGESGVLGLAVGQAARAGDMGARLLVRDALASSGVSPALVLALVVGIGDDAFDAGLVTLAGWARGALTDAARWVEGALRAAQIVAALPEPPPPKRVETLIELWTLAPSLRAASALLDAASVATRDAMIAVTRRTFVTFPSSVRAAVVQDTLRQAAQARSQDGPPALLGASGDLLRERAPEVLDILLRLISLLGDTLADSLRRALGRALSDHPDAAIRKALAFAIPPPEIAADPMESAAEVIALPPAAFIRDDLDRLRAAIWEGEGERLSELALTVPLAQRGEVRAALRAALEIPNAPLRRSAVEALGRVGSVTDAPSLLDAARRYRALEGTVAAALRGLAAKSSAEALAEIYQRRLKWADDDAVDDYFALAGPERVGYLMAALNTRYYPAARAGAARALARHRVSEAAFALRDAALSDTQPSARMSAMSAFHDLLGSTLSADDLSGFSLLFRTTEELNEAVERARRAGSAALAGVRRTLAQGSWKRRAAACEVLATLPTDEATAVLVETLEDADEDVRAAAVEALIQRGWEPATPRERTLMALATRRILVEASELLAAARRGTLEQEFHLETLLEALILGGFVFRNEVLELLDAVRGALRTPLTSRALATLAAARRDVPRALAYPEGLQILVQLLAHTWQAMPHRARYVPGLKAVSVEALDGALAETESWRARETIAQALERPDEPGAARLLGRLLTEDDDDVRRAALQSLAWMGTSAAAAALAQGFESPFQEDRDAVAHALGTLGPVATAVVDRLSGSAWWEERHGAAVALGRWRTGVQAAVDRLIVLALDPEYRVAQAAQEGLVLHGLLPTDAAVVAALMHAQTLTLEGVEPWLGLYRAPSLAPALTHALEALFEHTPPNALPQRLGLAATFRVEALLGWLQGRAGGEGSGHVGVRLAAADAVRVLLRSACPVCTGDGRVRCPGCGGAGDTACPVCAGRGATQTPCPDPECTAQGKLRRIDSRRCPTCRGRGEIPTACTSCEASRGRVVCALCHGGGRLGCVACDGSGQTRGRAGGEAEVTAGGAPG